MARHLTLIDGPPQVVTMVPAPILVVRHLASGREMARFPAVSHVLAKKVAAAWRGRCEYVQGGPSVVLDGHARPKGTPWAS